MIDSLGYIEVSTFDMHSPQARKCVSNLRDVPAFKQICDVKKLLRNPVTLLPDEGAKRYGITFNVLQCSKIRNKETGELSGFQVPPYHEFGGDWKNPTDVLIVDDICDGGGTFIGIAKELVSYNLNLYLYISHGIFSKGRGELSEYFKHIYTTNSFTKEFENVTRFDIF